MFKIFLKFFASLFLGCFLILFFIKDDYLFKKFASERLQFYASDFYLSNISFSVKKINLFPLSFELTDIVAFPNDGDDWSWSCSSFLISPSWIDFLFYRSISLEIFIDGLKVKTVVSDDGISVWNKMFDISNDPPFGPIFLQSLKIRNVEIQMKEPYADIETNIICELDSITVDNVMKAVVRFSNGNVQVKNLTVLNNINGPVRFDVIYSPYDTKLMINTKLNIDLPQADDKTFYLSGLWKYKQGVFSLKNDSRSFVIAPIKLYSIGKTLFTEISADFPVSYLYKIFLKDFDSNDIVGRCSIGANVEFEGASSLIRGVFRTGNIKYKNKNMFLFSKVLFSRDSKKWNGNIFVSKDEKNRVKGDFLWDEQKGEGKLKFFNNTLIDIPIFDYWNIFSKKLSTEIIYKNDGSINGSYFCVADNKKIGSKLTCSGSFDWNGSLVSTCGKLDDNKFSFSCDINPFYVKNFLWETGDGKSIIDIKEDGKISEKFVGTISYSVIKKILKKFDCDLLGQGSLKLYGSIKDKKLLTKLNLFNGNIRVPNTYNFINGLSVCFSFDPYDNSIVMKDLNCSLNRGFVSCKKANFLFDDDYNISFFHVPIIFNNCLINWKKDLFAILSGNLFYKKEKGKLSFLRGNIFVDRSELKRNIFSYDFQKSFLNITRSVNKKEDNDIKINLILKTKDPVRVKTSFLQTSAKIDCIFGGTLNDPNLTGSISILSGSLLFPYKSLYITGGFIDFSSGNIDDPAIEIFAHNKLKKYTVNLDVSGSLKQPEIRLESSPSLTEEQIISLLFAGSEKESLNLLMPALIMQNLKGILFDSHQLQTGISKSFSRLFKPFENVHLVPSFIDQTGRGGLRAALEIDVSERWRALIQKNFSLTEDTKVEIEYLLSDDISLLGVRNEAGDISAEVEMRWKF